MPQEILVFYIILFAVAFLYASVGHGGASGYLALMAIYGIAPEVMKPTALLLNLFVSLTAFIQFYRGGHFIKTAFWPFAVASIPLAYLGGRFHLQDALYKKILGLLLLLPVLRFLFFKNPSPSEMRPQQTGYSLLIGGVIGLLSGMMGIGGGIILSPILLLLKWTDQKQTAAISALFIFVNSIAGLIGQWSKGITFTTEMYLYVGIAFAGGLLGAYFGAKKFNHNLLKNVLAFCLLIAAFKLLFPQIKLA